MPKRKLRKSNVAATRTRDESGTFAAICGCINHDDWSFSEIFEVKRISSRRFFSKKVIRSMRKKHLPERGNTLCTACYNHFKNRLVDHIHHIHSFQISDPVEASCLVWDHPLICM